MSVLRSVPLWGYFVILGVFFVSGHLLAYRPDPAMRRARRLAGRWGSSLLLLVGLLLVSNRHVGTVLPAALLALFGGVVSGRTAPPSAERGASDGTTRGGEGAEDRRGAGERGRPAPDPEEAGPPGHDR